MAEARSEEEDENMTRDTREQQVARRQSNGSGGRPNRRKPEHRISQGPLSSIRAAIKRTSARTTPPSEPSRERERDRHRDRRRPEITILSAEPLTPTSWFPGTSGGFPPPPPPAAQIWGPTIPPSIQPPPSYEEVIREKTQEQGLLPSSSSSSSCASSSHSASTITIATQTDSGSAPVSEAVKRPVRPSRPALPHPLKPATANDGLLNESPRTSLDSDIVLSALPEGNTSGPARSQYCDLFPELCSPFTSNSAAQTEPTFVSAAAPPQIAQERPRPRPRSRLSAPPTCSEVKVQTLVKLREDGLATLAAQAGASQADQGVSQGVSQGRYLQELLEAFSADDWGFPERSSDGSECSQSDSEEDDEKEDRQDMATLKARIQAFEQQPVSDGSCGSSNNGDFDGTKRPEPRPRPRLQPQPAKSPPPTIAPKPKNFSHTAKPSAKLFWEASDSNPVASDSCSSDGVEAAGSLQTTDEHRHSLTATSCSDSTLQPCKETEKPPLSQKPSTEALLSSTAVPVPAPRPAPPKAEPQPRLPPRPAVAPRASAGPANQEMDAPAGNTIPSLPPRPGSGTRAGSGSDGTQDAVNTTVRGSVRPGLPAKPAALSSPRRAKPTLPKPPGAGPSLKHVAPVPAQRKGSVIQPQPENTNEDPPLPPRPSNTKQLPLRPPPIKSTPGRPPPPATAAIDSTSSSHLTTPPASKATPVPASTSKALSSHATSAVSATQRAPKKGPPLPPRPKPGHPLFNSCTKQEVLIVLDDSKPSEDPSGDGRSQTAVTPIMSPSQCLLDLDIQPNRVPEGDGQSKPALMDHSLPDAQSILPLQPPEQKEQPDLSPARGPRCVALFDYEGEEEDELTFSQGDVIALLQLIGQEWARGEIHGRVGIFPLSFTEVVEPLAQSGSPSAEMTSKTEPNTLHGLQSEAKEWAVALFDFPGQTAEDLSFHKGAMIQVLDHIDAEWRRGRVEGKEGLYPAAFTQSCQGQPIPGEQSAVKGVAKFDFTAESEDELTLKAGDVITQVESVDEQWILGFAGGKRGIVPKSFISIP
ncbi:uncharacterized protein LOC142893527 isoform X3 [Nelusetta ayraudi]|uniref:uncharacterized protein LOC142893527 isoform X3 n=1 Tax=Nelusetta ayraudi TaxID=303726 RepID=UPI003F727B4A